jgi:hypothetical protein
VFNGNAVLTNCVFSGNWVFYDNPTYYGFGGAVYINASSSPGDTCSLSLLNCLFNDNWSDQYGGAISVLRSTFTADNCTFAGNSALYGNALACRSREGGGAPAPSTVQITNSILWDGGSEIWNDYGSTLSVTYSDVEGGSVGDGNIETDPNFISGPLGDYYLSQIAAGQASNSPCVNTGIGTAGTLGLGQSTTRTDGVSDEGVVDMGYHERNIADLDIDWDVDSDDALIMALRWLQTPGAPSADIAPVPAGDNFVDYLDFAALAASYEGD